VSALDKIKNKVQVLAGQATEKYGQATGNKQQQGRRRTKQARGTSKQAAQKIKDMFKWVIHLTATLG